MEHVQGNYLKAKDKSGLFEKKKRKKVLHPEEKALNQTTWYFVSILSFFPVSFSFPICNEDLQKMISKTMLWVMSSAFCLRASGLTQDLGHSFLTSYPVNNIYFLLLSSSLFMSLSLSLLFCTTVNVTARIDVKTLLVLTCTTSWMIQGVVTSTFASVEVKEALVFECARIGRTNRLLVRRTIVITLATGIKCAERFANGMVFTGNINARVKILQRKKQKFVRTTIKFACWSIWCSLPMFSIFNTCHLIVLEGFHFQTQT